MRLKLRRILDDRKSPDGNESRAYVCLLESEKTGKDDSQEGKKGSPKAFCLQSESGAFIASDFVFTFLLHFVLQVL